MVIVDMKNEHFELSPMEEYSTPAYPTRATKSSASLKKLPVRWVKSAAVVACIGAMGLSMLTGCRFLLHGGGAGGAPIYVAYPTEVEAVVPVDPIDLHGGGEASMPYYVAYPTEQEVVERETQETEYDYDVLVHAHWGGSGAGPFYVAYLTEHEALGVIRNELLEAGIYFAPPASEYVATFEGSTDWTDFSFSATLSLFNEDTRQGIVFPISWSWADEFHTGISHEEIERELQKYFADQFDISVTFMRNPGESIGDFDWDMDAEPIFTDEEKEEARQNIHEQLRLQVTELLDNLRAEGIL